MATQIVISNKDYVRIDDGYRIPWNQRGNAMPELPHNIPESIHYVVWNTLQGSNEIQKCDGEGTMIGNTPLTSVEDVVYETTTVQDLLDWGQTRKAQLETANADNDEAAEAALQAHIDGGGTEDDFVWNKTWADYDPAPL